MRRWNITRRRAGGLVTLRQGSDRSIDGSSREATDRTHHARSPAPVAPLYPWGVVGVATTLLTRRGRCTTVRMIQGIKMQKHDRRVWGANSSWVMCVGLASVGCEVHGLVGSDYLATTSGTDGGEAGAPPMTSAGADETGDSEPSLDVGGGLVSYGEWWCVRAEGATYAGNQPVVYEDLTAAEGCQCVAYNTEVHAWILDHEVDSEVSIDQPAIEAELGQGAPLVDALLELRTEIYSQAANECISLSPPLLANTCAEPQIFDIDPSTEQLDPRPIYRGNRDGEVECVPWEGIAPGCPFVQLQTSIHLSNGVYDVPRVLFDGFVGAPACLMQQGWGIGLASNGGFALNGVGRGDALHRLGLRSGDRFVALTSGGVRRLLDVEGAMSAYSTFRDQSSFTLEIHRGTTPVTLRYRVTP